MRRARKERPAEADGFVARTDRELKRERIDKLIAGIRENRPFWASMAPWVAEPFLEGTAVVQRDLFSEGTGE